MQSEAMVSNATKSTYQKKYKCPYCEGRFTRAKLHIHIQEKHEDLIPEGYTALRVAFNTINNKTEGHCIMCGNVTDWNEDKGRYERLCNDPKCHEAYKKMVAERTKKKYRLGENVKVSCSRVDIPNREIFFDIIEDESAKQEIKPSKELIEKLPEVKQELKEEKSLEE